MMTHDHFTRGGVTPGDTWLIKDDETQEYHERVAAGIRPSTGESGEKRWR